MAASLRTSCWKLTQSQSRGLCRQRRATLLCDKWRAAFFVRVKASLPHEAADRRGLPPAQAGVRMGWRKRTTGESTAIKEGQTIYAFKRELFRLPIPEHLPQCDAFSVAA